MDMENELLPLCLFVCLSDCLYVCLTVSMSVFVSVFVSVCLSVCLSACLPACLSVCLSLGLCASVSLCLTVCMYVGPCSSYQTCIVVQTISWSTSLPTLAHAETLPPPPTQPPSKLAGSVCPGVSSSASSRRGRWGSGSQDQPLHPGPNWAGCWPHVRCSAKPNERQCEVRCDGQG